MAKELTPRQQVFVREYLIDLNATQAAIRAGYSVRAANRIGQRLLTYPAVRDEIDRLKIKRAEKIEITAEKVLQEIAKLSFVDPRKLFDANGKLRPISELEDDIAASIAGVDVVVDKKTGEEIRKVRLWDKRGSLELLGKHLKLFTDRVEHSGKVEKTVVVSINKQLGEDKNDTPAEGQNH